MPGTSLFPEFLQIFRGSEVSGSDSGLNNGQQYAADVNADGELNAVDAALILQYAAYAGAGGTLTFEEFLKTA